MTSPRPGTRRPCSSSSSGSRSVPSLLVAALTSELTDRHELEAVLRRRAPSDTLTGLPNRLALGDAIDRVLRAGAGDPTRVALLVCDIDHLKLVNDTMGHGAGDALILEVARRIEGRCATATSSRASAATSSSSSCTTSTRRTALALVRADTAAAVSRTGGARAAPPREPVAVRRAGDGRDRGQRRVRVQRRRRRPVRGEAAGPRPDGRVRRAAAPRRAGPARDRARRRRRDRGRPASRASTSRRSTSTTGAVVGLETLARWEHPQRGTIPPDRFVPAAERTGQAGPLFDSILRQSLDAQARWAAELGTHLTVAVNLSPRAAARPRPHRVGRPGAGAAGAPPGQAVARAHRERAGRAVGARRARRAARPRGADRPGRLRHGLVVACPGSRRCRATCSSWTSRSSPRSASRTAPTTSCAR